MIQPVRESDFLNAGDSIYFLGRWPDADTWCVVRRSSTDGGESISTRSEGEAKALWDRCVNGQRCVECTAPIAFDENYGNSAEKAARIAAGVCFSCNYWLKRATETGQHIAIIDCYRYTIEPDKPEHYQGFIGHGGAKFAIRFYDGREVVTCNLWAQGRIPDHFRTRIADNAVFIEVARHAAYIGHGSAIGAKSKS